MKVDPVEEPDIVYRTLSSLVVPRPIGWISTVDEAGNENLAPYSYFNAVCNDPPTVMFSANDPDDEGDLKDTPRNAIETGEFVTNLVTEELVDAMDATSQTTERSEFDVSDLGRVPAETVAPPRVAEARATLECEVVESLRIGTNTLVFGQVKLFHVDDSLVTNRKVDARKIEAIGRYGGPHYTRRDLLEYTRTY